MKTNENASKVREKKVQEVVKKLDRKVVLYDPPEGWRYGFPKPYDPLPGEDLVVTLVRDGYPEDLAKSLSQWCRFIGDYDPADYR